LASDKITGILSSGVVDNLGSSMKKTVDGLTKGFSE
jgi:hypothetical protein